MNTVFNKSNAQDLKMVPSIHIQESHNLKIQMRERCKTIIDKNKKPIKKVIIGGKKIPVDAGIAPVIQILNDKGYKTVVCCEGHYDEHYENYTSVWIGFANGYLPPRPRISGYERHARQLQTQKYPSYWYGPRFNQCRPKSTFYHGRKMMPEIKIFFTKYKRDMKKRDIHEEHQRVLDELVKWAKSLPEHDKFISQRMENWCRRPIGDINFENGEWDDYYDVAEDLSIDLDKEWEKKWKCKLEEQYR